MTTVRSLFGIAAALLVISNHAWSANVVSTFTAPDQPSATGSISTMPHVPDNATLLSKPTTAYPNGVWRMDFASGIGAPPLFFIPQTGTCSSVSMTNDNGSCVNDPAGNSWKAKFPSSGIDTREFGVASTGSGASNLTALNNASAAAYAQGLPLVITGGLIPVNAGFTIYGAQTGTMTPDTCLVAQTDGPIIGTAGAPNTILGGSNADHMSFDYLCAQPNGHNSGGFLNRASLHVHVRKFQYGIQGYVNDSGVRNGSFIDTFSAFVTTATTTNNSATITGVVVPTTPSDEPYPTTSMVVTDSFGCIPTGTTIATSDQVANYSGSTVTLSVKTNLTGCGAGDVLSFYPVFPNGAITWAGYYESQGAYYGTIDDLEAWTWPEVRATAWDGSSATFTVADASGIQAAHANVIISATWSNGVATLTTTSPHGIAPGELVCLRGFTPNLWNSCAPAAYGTVYKTIVLDIPAPYFTMGTLNGTTTISNVAVNASTNTIANVGDADLAGLAISALNGDIPAGDTIASASHAANTIMLATAATGSAVNQNLVVTLPTPTVLGTAYYGGSYVADNIPSRLSQPAPEPTGTGLPGNNMQFVTAVSGNNVTLDTAPTAPFTGNPTSGDVLDFTSGGIGVFGTSTGANSNPNVLTINKGHASGYAIGVLNFNGSDLHVDGTDLSENAFPVIAGGSGLGTFVNVRFRGYWYGEYAMSGIQAVLFPEAEHACVSRCYNDGLMSTSGPGSMPLGIDYGSLNNWYPPGTLIDQKIFSASPTGAPVQYTPTLGTHLVRGTIIGGGGQGGGANASAGSTQGSPGGGGAAGTYTRFYVNGNLLTDLWAGIILGSGGTGALAGAVGTAGGNSIYQRDGGTTTGVVTAPGGNGGQAPVSGNTQFGAGGSSGGGATFTDSVNSIPTNNYGMPGGAGLFIDTGGKSGEGGSSPAGVGGQPKVGSGSTQVAGNNCAGFGSGGSGGLSIDNASGTAQVGGNGCQGEVVLEEWSGTLP